MRAAAQLRGTNGSREHSRLGRLLWLGVAVLAQFLLGLMAVLSRYLQVKASPPVPALRLTLLLNLIALGFLLCFHALPQLACRLILRRLQRGPLQHETGLPSLSESPAADLDFTGNAHRSCLASERCLHSTAIGRHCKLPVEQAQQVGGWPQPAAALPGEFDPEAAQQEQQGQQGQQEPQEQEPQQPRAPARVISTLHPEIPLQRGLSRRFEALEGSRPRLYRFLALALLTVAGLVIICGNVSAPRFVDPAIVQLVYQFQVLGVALVQSILLGHRIPWPTWPAAVSMVGGASMVIVPSLGMSEAGSLNTARGWLGFALAVLAVSGGVTSLVTMQATRHLGFNPLHLQYLILTASIPVLLALSLPIDGADWGAQLGPWTALDWVVLVLLATVVYIGSGVALQMACVELGAPTFSMTVGLRLVFSIVQSKVILSVTTIQTGLQIGGIAVTVAAVTAYMAWLWYRSQQQAAAAEGVQPGPAEDVLSSGSEGSEKAGTASNPIDAE